MTTPTDPQREHPSTYFVKDRSNEDERMRVMIQDQLVTEGMGGVLPEQADPTEFTQVLDVACGTGGWLIEFAKANPSATRLVGVDVSERMIEYARKQAEEAGVGDRVQFQTMDALRMLEFPDDSFDLVNQRFGVSYLRTWDWSKLLWEFKRVARPGGVVRLTEANMVVESSCEVLTRLLMLTVEAFHRAGHYFAPQSDGITSQLCKLLELQGIDDIQTRAYDLYYQGGTTAGQLFAEDTERAWRVGVPFLRKWSRLPDDYDAFYQQLVDQVRAPDFVGTWHLLTAWGRKP